MAIFLIALEQGELFRRGAGGHFGNGQISIGAQDAPLGAVWREFLAHHADRHAGLAAGANRRIGNIVAAAKASARKAFMQSFRFRAGKLGHDLPLRPARQIGAGQRRGRIEELRTAGWAMQHAALFSPQTALESTTFHTLPMARGSGGCARSPHAGRPAAKARHRAKAAAYRPNAG